MAADWKAVLFDLDDTLLENDMTVFGPAYLALWGQRCRPWAPPAMMIAALRRTIDHMLQHEHPALTNETYFWQDLPFQAGLPEAVLRACMERFCAEDFPTLRAFTQPRAQARAIVGQARAHGWKVVLATNPMFPRATTAQRIVWAGLAEADFDHITWPEITYACKPQEAYFLEILRSVDVEPAAALLIGDDWQLDMIPAMRVGLRTFWVRNRSAAPPSAAPQPDALGTWPEFVEWWNRQTMR